MDDEHRYSKRQVSRAGEHLAGRLIEVRSGRRDMLVDADDSTDVHAREVVEWWRDQHDEPMLEVHESVARLAPALRVGDHLITAVTSRSKRFSTVIEKLTREPVKLADMADLGGVRAVVNHQAEVDALREALGRALDVRRVRDWARNPRASGYRAVHLHVHSQGRIIEVQLRTFGQDAWANLVEQESRLSGSNYKSGDGSEAVLDFFRVMAEMIASFELGEAHPGLPARLDDAWRRAKSRLTTSTLRRLAP